MNALPSRDPRDHFLTPLEQEDLFTRHVQPLIEARRPVAHPTFMPIMGQVGAGKTTLATVLPPRLGVVDPYILEHDDLERLHPAFTDLRAAYGEMEAREVIDASESILPLLDAAQDVALTSGRNIALPGPLANPDMTARMLTTVRGDFGARIHVVAVAVHEAHSLLGTVDRLRQEITQTGDGREIQQAWHDNQYTGILRTLRWIESEGLADTVTCVARDGLPVYHNTLVGSGPTLAWRDPPGAAAAVQTERSRMWTLGEHADFHRRAVAVAEFARTGRLPSQPALAAATALRRGVAFNELAVGMLRERESRAPSLLEARSLAQQADQRTHYNRQITAAADRLDSLAGLGPKGRAAAARRPSAGLGRTTPAPPSPSPSRSPSPNPRGGLRSIPPGRSTGRGSSPSR